MGTIREIKHVAGPGYTSGIATGMTLHGPTPDGNMQLTFFHDTAIPVHGTIEIATPGQTGPQVSQDTRKENFDVVRHNIATISMHPSQIKAIGAAFSMVAEQMDAKLAAKGVDPGTSPNVTA